MIPKNPLSRRQFVSGLAIGAATLGGCRRNQDDATTAMPSEDADGVERQDGTAESMPNRRLGKTGLRVPILEVGGTCKFSARFVKQAMSLGCTFFDTAAVYSNGQSEKTLGSALDKLGVREQVTIVTKGHAGSPGRLEKKIDESLARLQTDHVDIYYLHNFQHPEALADPAWRQEVDRLKKTGKIRHFGFSTHNEHTVRLLNEAAKTGWIDVIMLKYNFRSYGDDELNRAIDAAHKADIGLIAMKTQGSAVSFASRVDPFQQAGYSKHQAVLKAVWQDERLSAAVSLMPSIAVLRQNAAAAHSLSRPARGFTGRDSRESGYEKGFSHQHLLSLLSPTESRLLADYAAATKDEYCHGGCGGCHRECEQALERPTAIADTLRYLMYHDVYGRRESSRSRFAKLPPHRRTWSDEDLSRAAAACPHGLPLPQLLARAAEVMAPKLA